MILNYGKAEREARKVTQHCPDVATLSHQVLSSRWTGQERGRRIFLACCMVIILAYATLIANMSQQVRRVVGVVHVAPVLTAVAAGFIVQAQVLALMLTSLVSFLPGGSGNRPAS
jgi:hypothetical protein